MYIQNPNPTGSLALSALLAALPLVTLLVLLGGLRVKAQWAGLSALVVALAVAVVGYRMGVGQALDSGLLGVAAAVLQILWITFNAIWIYNLTVASGHFAVLRRSFATISDDARIQAIVIAFSFGALIEALAGGGSPVAICTVMLVAIGFAPMKAIVLALVADTAPVAFGGLGNPITILGAQTGIKPELFGAMAGRQTAFLALLIPFVLLLIADGRRGLREAWPAALTAGLSFAVTQLVVSAWSYRLCDIAAALVSAVAVLALGRVWKPASGIAGRPIPAVAGGSADHAPDSRTEVARAFAPYAIIIFVFALAQVDAVKAWLNLPTRTFAWPGLHVLGATGKPVGLATYTFNWLGATGTLLFVSGLVTMLVLGISPPRALRIYGRTLVQFNWAILTILCVFALAYVMNLSGQITTLGQFLARTGGFFAFLSPIVGWFGVAITGTDAGSNALFAKLQTTAAGSLHSSPVLFGAANSSGGVLAKMVSPQNLAIGTAAAGLVGQEGTLFRRVAPWSVALLGLLCVLVFLQSTPVLGWMVP